MKDTPISEIEYGKDILVFIKGEQVKRHYDEIYCVGCGGFIEVRRVMSGPRKGDLPRSAEHNIRKTHGGKCQYLYMQKMFSKKLPEEFEEIEQPKNRRYTAVPARGEVWGTFKPKRITLIEKHLDMFDLWIEGKVGHVVRKVKLRLAA